MSVEDQFQPTTDANTILLETTDFMSVEDQLQPTTDANTLLLETTDFTSVEFQLQPNREPHTVRRRARQRRSALSEIDVPPT